MGKIVTDITPHPPLPLFSPFLPPLLLFTARPKILQVLLLFSFRHLNSKVHPELGEILRVQLTIFLPMYTWNACICSATLPRREAGYL